MILVSLEGLPHSGKKSVLRSLAHLRPSWTTLNVAPDGPSEVTHRMAHALFAALMRKIQALRKLGPHGAVVLLNSPWFEHLPRHNQLWTLFADMTHELTSSLGCHVDMHALIMLKVPHDETFEQMVCCTNAFWNTTSLGDVHAAEHIIAEHLRTLPGAGDHPFPCATYAITCPPFFEENEILVKSVAHKIVDIVEKLA